MNDFFSFSLKIDWKIQKSVKIVEFQKVWMNKMMGKVTHRWMACFDGGVEHYAADIKVQAHSNSVWSYQYIIPSVGLIEQSSLKKLMK